MKYVLDLLPNKIISYSLSTVDKILSSRIGLVASLIEVSNKEFNMDHKKEMDEIRIQEIDSILVK